MRTTITLLLLFNTFIVMSQADLAREHISVLTSDSLAGRGFTANGQQKAADYIISQLQEYSIQPGNRDKFKQELSYPVNTFPTNTQFSVKNRDVIKIYAGGKDFLFHSASGPISIDENIKTISSGHHFTKKRKKQIYYLEKAAHNSAELNEMVTRFLFESNTKGNLLIVQDSSKWSWFPSPKQSENTVVYVKERLDSNARINATNEAVFKPRFTSSNIIGKIDGQRSDSVIMLSAHYDHLGQMASTIFPGGNDNASGVSMLLSLAKHWGQNQPKFDTYFLFTTAEEIGLLGSQYFIENAPFNLRKIKMLINLDMVGTGDEGITVVNAEKQSRYFKLLKELNKDRISEIKKRGQACNSDHCLFDQIGIPAVFIYTLGGKQAYHDIYDSGDDLSLKAFDALHDLIISTSEKY